MSDEESFIILGSTPTPSMEQFVSGGEGQFRQESMAASKLMATSTTQTISNNFSLIQAADESLKSLTSMKITSPPKSMQQVAGMAAPDPVSIKPSNPLAASVIMGETKSSLFQTFPSLMQSSMPLDEVQMLQVLMTEHGQMKESLQKANLAMRKNFTNIQSWQDEVKDKYTKQVQKIEEQSAIIGKLEEENDKLKQLVVAGEARAADQEKRAAELKITLEKALDEVQMQIQAERASALGELDELKKALSEKESILKNMAREIERLELEKQEFVVVKPNKPDASDSGAQFITKEEHDRQIKVLQREMSVIVAKNLEFEDMKKVYVDELNCMRVNLTAAEEIFAKNRAQLERQAKEIETKDVSLAENIRELKTLAEQVDVLTAQLDIYKNDFEAERTARSELASEKDRVLTDLKLLQKRNQQLIEEVQNGRVAEERATRAANESLDKREPSPSLATSAHGVKGAAASEEQTYDRPILYCPLCTEAYRDLVTLQAHVEDCVGTV